MEFCPMTDDMFSQWGVRSLVISRSGSVLARSYWWSNLSDFSFSGYFPWSFLYPKQVTGLFGFSVACPLSSVLGNLVSSPSFVVEGSSFLRNLDMVYKFLLFFFSVLKVPMIEVFESLVLTWDCLDEVLFFESESIESPQTINDTLLFFSAFFVLLFKFWNSVGVRTVEFSVDLWNASEVL